MQDFPAVQRLRTLVAKAELPIDNADERRRRAQQALDHVLHLAIDGHFPLGAYRRRCLASAIVAIRSGYYDLALDEVAAALDGNDMPGSSSSPPGYTAEDLKKELDVVRGYPLIER
jgi:hypothetical protein